MFVEHWPIYMSVTVIVKSVILSNKFWKYKWYLLVVEVLWVESTSYLYVTNVFL